VPFAVVVVAVEYKLPDRFELLPECDPLLRISAT
jgi:hypothetical protein